MTILDKRTCVDGLDVTVTDDDGCLRHLHFHEVPLDLGMSVTDALAALALAETPEPPPAPEIPTVKMLSLAPLPVDPDAQIVVQQMFGKLWALMSPKQQATAVDTYQRARYVTEVPDGPVS